LILWDGNRNILKGNLHLHTTLSDGRKTPEEAMEIYKNAGYDFLAITDHRKMGVKTQSYRGMTVLQGIEFDFYLPGQVIHIVGVGADEGVADAVQRFESAQKAINAINAHSGAAILAHPAWSLNTPQMIGSLYGLAAAEIYNSVSGLPWNGDRADSSSVLDIAAANGNLLNFVASDDTHFYSGEEFMSFTRLAAEDNSAEAIVRALKAGDFYASQGPEFRKIELENDVMRVWCSPASAIVFLSDLPWVTGRSKCGEDLTYAELRVERERGLRFMRVLLIDKNGKRAWSNPFDMLKY